MPQDSRFFVGVVTVSLVFFLAVIAVGSEAGSKRRNVLFIAVDDMRVQLGCYGSVDVQSPNIDRLARRGRRFERAYCQQALCNPSRASLLTGRRPDTLRVWNLSTHFRDTHADIVTLPQRFLRSGYFTRDIGKIFHNWRTKIGGDPRSWSVPAEHHFATHGSDWVYPAGVERSGGKKEVSQSLAVEDGAYFDGIIADKAVAELRHRAKRDEPFFLAVGFWKPHLPFNAPRRYWKLYDPTKLEIPERLSVPEGVPDLALHSSRELRGYGGVPKQGEIPRQLVRHLWHGYLAAISFVDAQVGRILDELDRTGLAASTVVVLWSDHGFHLGEHGIWAKTSNFELDARVPLIIAYPGIPHAGESTDALVELLDLYPTLVDLCDLPAPPGLEGVSLRPVLEDPTGVVKRGAFTQHPRPAYYGGETPPIMGCSVRTDRFRYTEWRRRKDGKILARELYDHRRDPAEMENVADAPPDGEAFAEAAALLEERFGAAQQ